MSTRPTAKDFINQPVDDQDSSDEQSTYEEETSRSKAIHGRHDAHEEDDSSDSEEEEENSKDSDIEDYFVGDNYDDDEEDDGNASDAKEAASSQTQKGKKSAKPLSEKAIAKARNKEAKSGVVYMSRVPPFMKPVKVRHMLKKYAEIGR
ncbi:hypothetical protein EV175_007425, partial [Coemansia sp. RSA 1933]